MVFMSKTPSTKWPSGTKHCHIVETTIVMLSHVYVPSSYLFDACQTLTYLINRLPT